MKIQFQADADLKRSIIRGTLKRAPGVDFQRAERVPLSRLPDPMVLALAADQGRVLVSHDVSTMEQHFREFVSRRNSPGLILIPQIGVTIREAVEGLVLIWEVLERKDLENRICRFPSLDVY